MSYGDLVHAYQAGALLQLPYPEVSLGHFQSETYAERVGRGLEAKFPGLLDMDMMKTSDHL